MNRKIHALVIIHFNFFYKNESFTSYSLLWLEISPVGDSTSIGKSFAKAKNENIIAKNAGMKRNKTNVSNIL